jgi:hypothetical protein
MKPNSLMMAAACAVLGVTLSGCVIGPIPGESGVVTYQAPPQPVYEEVGVAPTPGYIWIGGAWFWEGGRYAWHRGHWEAPRPGYAWVPHSWRRDGDRWRMQRGHWERRAEGHEGRRDEHREDH